LPARQEGKQSRTEQSCAWLERGTQEGPSKEAEMTRGKSQDWALHSRTVREHEALLQILVILEDTEWELWQVRLDAEYIDMI
jgi:hypothetical protein